MHPLLLRSWSESLATLRMPMRAVFILFMFTLLTRFGQWLVLAPNEFGANIKTLAIAIVAMGLIFTVIFITHLDSAGFFRAVLAQNLPSLKEDCIVSILYVDAAAKPDASVIKSSFEMAGYGPMEINRTVSNQHRSVTIESSDSELLRDAGRAFQCVGVGATMRFKESPQILLQIVVKDRIGY